MAPLKLLEADYPFIDSVFQHFCSSHGIFSVEDLLIHNLDDLVALAEQCPTSNRLKQGITEILTIIDSRHQRWLNGLELLEDSHKCKQILSTGCGRIDAFLQGGLREGFLTELVGPSSSGKTQACLLMASNVARIYSGEIMFIDTGNSFSPKRIAQFVNGVATEGDEVLQLVLDRILCRPVFDIFTLLDVLHELISNLKFQVVYPLRLLIVDSISSLISPVLGGSGTQGHALMVSAGFLLKKLAHEHNVAVLVTNHTVGGEGGATKPALGESWKNIPHVRLMLSRDHASNVYSMSILRHPSMATGIRVEYTIP